LSSSEIEEAVARLHALKERLDADERIVLGDAADVVEELRAENARLAEQVKYLLGKPYRKKDEGVAPGQLALDLIEMLKGKLDGDLSEHDASYNETTEDAEPAIVKKKRPRRGRNLARQIVECRLTETDRACECCAAPKAEIGFDAQERFIYEPAKVYILEERRFKYACPRCQDGVEQAESTLVPKPIAGSMASSSLLAFLVVSKVLDGLPVHRIAKILTRHGVDLATSTLNDWFGRVGDMLSLVRKQLRLELLECELISLDDTPLKAQSRDHPKGTVSGRQWLYIGNKGHVLYAEYTPDWKGTHPRRVLDGYRGVVQNDGYAGINPLFVGDGAPMRIGCNDHARRKFVAALECGDARAQSIIDRYRAMYLIEAKATKEALDTAARLALRKEMALPIWNELAAEVAKLAPQAGKKSPLGKAVTYFTRQRPYLAAFLDDGFLPISNVHVEQKIRTVAVFRKNALFVGSVEAGERFSVLLTVLLNCQLCGANPYDYLADVIDLIAQGHPVTRIAELTPRRWQELREAKQKPDRQAAPAAAGHR
jgi:transposase